MPYTLYTSADSGWTETLRQLAVHDAYHLASYHRLAEDMGHGRAYLFAYRQGDDCAAVPFLVRPVAQVSALAGREELDATSVYGYPGVLANIEVEAFEAQGFRVEFQDALRTALVELGVVA